MKTKRIIEIDFLRTEGLLLIILAHVNAPGFLSQLRNFDVVLMVFVIGMSYGYSAKLKYTDYIKKRFKRLVVPVWKFLILFVCFLRIVGIKLSLCEYFSSFALLSGEPNWGGVGYVWIFRVYFLVACISPLLKKWSDSIPDDRAFFVTWFFSFFLLEQLCSILLTLDGVLSTILIETFVYGFRFGLVCVMGMRAPNMSNKTCYLLILSFCILFLILLVNRQEPTQIDKYPPRIYYLSYALMMTLLSYILTRIPSFYVLMESKFISFISSNSMTIYLVHIILLYCIKINQTLSQLNYVVKYAFVLFFSCIITVLYKQVSGTRK